MASPLPWIIQSLTIYSLSAYHLVQKYLVSTYCVSGTLLESGDIAMSITCQNFCPSEDPFQCFSNIFLKTFDNCTNVYECYFLMNMENFGTVFILLGWFF